MCLAVQEQKAFYQFDSASTETADDSLIVAPDEGEGRWLALGSPGSGGGGGGSVPLTGSYYSTPIGNNTPAFIGQLYIATDGGEYGSTAVYVANGTGINDWQRIYYFSSG
jgi:hypothetical protein